mgnify:CR=1 FL=1
MRLKSYLLLIVISAGLMTACNNSIKKAFQELENMPIQDYSYVVQPKYSETKEALEFKIKELFSSDEVKVGAVGLHKYNDQTNSQENEKYWIKAVLLNSKSIEDFKDEQKMDALGREVAKSVLANIINSEKYDKIEITFVLQWNDGVQRQVEQNIFYKIPQLEVTTLE